MFDFSNDFISFENDCYFENFENLIFRINEHVVFYKYAVVFERIKKSKLKKRRKT